MKFPWTFVIVALFKMQLVKDAFETLVKEKQTDELLTPFVAIPQQFLHSFNPLHYSR
jgi:hypothetical protein